MCILHSYYFFRAGNPFGNHFARTPSSAMSGHGAGWHHLATVWMLAVKYMTAWAPLNPTATITIIIFYVKTVCWGITYCPSLDLGWFGEGFPCFGKSFLGWLCIGKVFLLRGLSLLTVWRPGRIADLEQRWPRGPRGQVVKFNGQQPIQSRIALHILKQT